MSLFNFSAAINNLVGNTPGANVANLVQVLNDIKTFLNGGNLDYSNLASTVQAQYNTLEWREAQTSGATIGTYVFAPVLAGGFVATTGTTAGQSVFWLDSARYPSGSRAPKLAVAATTVTNGTAPTSTYTYGLYPVTAVAGAGGNSVTLGAVVAGSTAAVTAPGANSVSHAESSEISFPAAGAYALGMAISGANEAAGAFVCHHARLEWRPT